MKHHSQNALDPCGAWHDWFPCPGRRHELCLVRAASLPSSLGGAPMISLAGGSSGMGSQASHLRATEGLAFLSLLGCFKAWQLVLAEC